ncbi:MAG: hypothetical protein OXI24_13555 [Candidatus Poribacteria bacterium]|nr:hypothetical protein [Candidatus Poribacteria bacterium]MYK19296.1 hypothetical protein [Candidatus Poribacteria bacterium]
MKTSLCQMITIVCILAVGFLMVTPFVPEAAAHSYTVSYYEVSQDICQYGTIHGSQTIFLYSSTVTHGGEHGPAKHSHRGPTSIYTFTVAYGGCPTPSYCSRR